MTTTTTVRDEMMGLERGLRSALVERDEEVRGLMLALIAKQHVFLFGPPGTGKSMLAERACAALDGATYFGWLLGAYTVPEELFGPLDIAALKGGAYVRRTARKLPEAQIAFLDEIWKAGSGVLNTLLRVANERIFDAGDGPRRVPLQALVCASNEYPEDASLRALYDRVLLRYAVQPLSPLGFERLLDGATADVPTVAMTTLEAAQAEAAAVPISAAAKETLRALRAAIGSAEKLPSKPSDRRWVMSLSVLRAAAWLAGDAEVTPEHCWAWEHMGWDRAEERETLRELLAQVIVSEASEAEDLLSSLRELASSLPAQDRAARARSLAALCREGKRMQAALTRLHDETGSTVTRERVAAAQRAAEELLAPLRAEQRELLGL